MGPLPTLFSFPEHDQACIEVYWTSSGNGRDSQENTGVYNSVSCQISESEDGMANSPLSRRYLLRAGFGALAAASTGGIAKGDRSGRKVLVCIYLFGGNDSNNMVAPLDDPQYAAYAAARGSLAIPVNSLLEVKAKNQARYGFHPALSELRDLYLSGALAVAANVGHLQQPMTRALLPSGGRSHLPGPLDSSLA